MSVYNIATGQEIQAEFAEAPEDGQIGGGGGTIGGMEARVAKLEASMEAIQRDISEIKGDIRDMNRDAREDFRLTWGGMIVAALGLAGIMAKGFGWI